jgi:hypothetical protein
MTKDEALKLALEALEIQAYNSGDEKYTQAMTALKEALAQPEQKPFFKFRECEDSQAGIATPPQRTWVWLTDKQMVDAIEPLYQNRATAEMAAKVSIDEFRVIEAKLKEKNGY